ncbi:MAG: DNA gyrase subunit A [Polyangiales bacterium]
MARKRKGKSDQIDLPMGAIDDASLAEETRRRYLNYALSVITSRALPDVRDGLKPVQRRILYTMHNELHLRSDAKYRKSAAIVGDVMGKFHPHGDTAIYDALVRLAQSFTMSAMLVDGRGNFGSPDGDGAAAMRYTEAKLQKLSDELLSELGKKTVGFRPNYDGTRFEPVVLPARFPNLLVNGSQGIAVGMATSIPPHNLNEVIRACVDLIDGDRTTSQLLKHIKGPDFPTGGECIANKAELQNAYDSGHGSLKLRGTYKIEDIGRGSLALVIDSIPYTIERRAVVEKIAEVIIQKKLPSLLDVRDESTEDCRIVCELKKDTDPQLVASYLYKHTPLQTNVQFNLTCLVPTANPDIAVAPNAWFKEILLRSSSIFASMWSPNVSSTISNNFKSAFMCSKALFRSSTHSTRRSASFAQARQSRTPHKKLMKRFKLDELVVDAILS